MSSLWPLDIKFFRNDVKIEKEIFWFTFTNVEQIRKEILKNFLLLLHISWKQASEESVL